MGLAAAAPPFPLRGLTPRLGAYIDLDVGRGLDDATFAAVYRAFLRYQVLVFPPQELPAQRQVDFGRRFGEVQIHVMNQYHADGFPELYRLSNLDANGRPNGKHPDKGTLAWHTDGSWQHITGQATIIYGEVMPEAGAGGETHFCDMYGAYERLAPQWKTRMAGLRTPQRGAATGAAAGRAPGGAHPSRDRAQVSLPWRPCRIHRRHAL